MDSRLILILSLVVACSSGSPGDDVGATSLPGIGTGGGTTEDEDEGEVEGEDGSGKLDVGAGKDVPDSTEECAAEVLEADLQHQGVDVVLVVDTSGSMGGAIAVVENSINDDFAAILEASGIDYRVIVLGGYRAQSGQPGICIRAPLSDTDCNPPPEIPAITDQYKHYDAITGSGSMMGNILDWYSTPDPHGLAPNGYRDLIREGTRKIILVMTDGENDNANSNAQQKAESFNQALLTLRPPVFGMPDDPQYTFHTITSMPVNDPVTEPWLPDDPISGDGRVMQRTSVLTGGWRFPLGQSQHFDVLFQEIAQDVIEATPIACSFPIPEPPPGEVIDPNTVELDYYPSGIGPVTLHQVLPAACGADAFYIESNTVFLCPEACEIVQADLMARIELRFGCEVGFDPAG